VHYSAFVNPNFPEDTMPFGDAADPVVQDFLRTLEEVLHAKQDRLTPEQITAARQVTQQMRLIGVRLEHILRAIRTAYLTGGGNRMGLFMAGDEDHDLKRLIEQCTAAFAQQADKAG
jgi:hypothetical protein